VGFSRGHPPHRYDRLCRIRIIETCNEAGLQEPELAERDGGFLVTLFKDPTSEERLNEMGFNARQVKAVQYVKENGQITNKEYQAINNVAGRTALRDLSELTSANVLKKYGKGKNTRYFI
jgi:ATP-dependent DNA helicase RecG